MQFDIFEHSRDVMLRNDVVHALERRDGAAAHVAWETLAREYPADESLPALLALNVAIERSGQPAFRDHDALHLHCWRCKTSCLPHCASSVTRPPTPGSGPYGANWRDVPPHWRFVLTTAKLTRRRCGCVQETGMLRPRRRSAIESWRRIPAPLAWMVQARLQLYGLQATWGMLAELAWLSPRRLDELVRQTSDPSLQQLIRKFEASFEGAADSNGTANRLLSGPYLPSRSSRLASTCRRPSSRVAPARALPRSTGPPSFPEASLPPFLRSRLNRHTTQSPLEAGRPFRAFFSTTPFSPPAAGLQNWCKSEMTIPHGIGGLSRRTDCRRAWHGNEQAAWQSVQERMAYRPVPPSVDRGAAVVPHDDEVGADLAREQTDGFGRLFPYFYGANRVKAGLAQQRKTFFKHVADAGLRILQVVVGHRPGRQRQCRGRWNDRQ